MASRISTLDLLKKVRYLSRNESTDESLDFIIQDAIKTADRELRVCDSLSPLAWDIVPWDGARTVAPADISAITQADPGVITADSTDDDVTGHGFPNHATIGSIVYIDGIDGMDELNKRFFLLTYINSTTFSLKNLDGSDAVDTSLYTAYSEGGTVYHMGIVLNATTMLTGIATTDWTVKEIIPDSITIDGEPAPAITLQEVQSNDWWITHGGRPTRTRYWQQYGISQAITHNLIWYGYSGDQYNVAMNYVKEVPDIATWDDSTYPSHPYEVHEYLWHGAMANLIGVHQQAKRTASYEREFGSVEIAFAEHWLRQWEADKIKVRNLSRKMLSQKHSWANGVSA